MLLILRCANTASTATLTPQSYDFLFAHPRFCCCFTPLFYTFLISFHTITHICHPFVRYTLQLKQPKKKNATTHQRAVALKPMLN